MTHAVLGNVWLNVVSPTSYLTLIVNHVSASDLRSADRLLLSVLFPGARSGATDLRMYDCLSFLNLEMSFTYHMDLIRTNKTKYFRLRLSDEVSTERLT